MLLIRTVNEMQEYALAQRLQGKTVALVPTMGNLHEGHLNLMREARGRCDLLAVSIFVNPTQFGPAEDFNKYPRTLEADLEKCRAQQVDVVFAPTAEDMYGADRGVVVEVGEWGQKLCGITRPGHFAGVATVVLKLFMICQPTLAVFGWKDAQQFLILRRMVRALNVPAEMMGVETVRESDGLAMSSRNQYLTPQERQQAPALYRALSLAREAVEHGERSATRIVEIACEHLRDHANASIDYVEAVDMETLDSVDQVLQGRTLLAAAIRFPTARLIDNVRF